MSDKVSDSQDRYISISQAMSILNVRFERITWFIATGELSSRPYLRDRNRKLVSLRDVYRLRNLPHLLAPWIIYALVDPRNDAVRYVGRAYEPQIRLREHINSEYAANPAKYRWIRELKKSGLLPRLEVLEGVYGSLQDADLRERYWIQYFVSTGAELTNKQYMG
jgi:hypothetical protein